MSEEGARRLGQRSRKEVEVADLADVLRALREARLARQSGSGQNLAASIPFSIPTLDALLSSSSPILELISPPPAHHPSGAGKTSLLQLITALATLPLATPSSIPIGGHHAAIILFDPLHHFSIPRLAKVMLTLLKHKIEATDQTLDSTTRQEIKQLVKESLKHVHIFRPGSWDAVLETLQALPDYLFDSSQHHSTHRRIHSILLDNMDSFAWAIRDASAPATPKPDANPLSTASKTLTTALLALSAQLSCAVVMTSSSASPTAFRSPVPALWTHGPHSSQAPHVTRLAMRRAAVPRFAAGISAEQAEREKEQRWDVVGKGVFECWKVGGGGEEREGMVFRIDGEGVEMEREGEGGSVRRMYCR